MSKAFIIQACRAYIRDPFWTGLGYVMTEDEAKDAVAYLQVLNDPNISKFDIIEVEIKGDMTQTDMITIVRKYAYSDQSHPVSMVAFFDYEARDQWTQEQNDDIHYCTVDPIQRWDSQRRNWKGGIYDNWA